MEGSYRSHSWVRPSQISSKDFAPSGLQVDSLIGFLNRSYPNFRRIQVFIQSTESVGIDYIMNHLEEPTLALIVLRQISTVKVNYLIRQNYTTLPNFNLIE